MAVEPQVIAAWLRRLAMLDARVFEDLRNNPAATVPAVLVTCISMLLAGLGGWIWWLTRDFPSSSQVLQDSAIAGALAAAVLWGGAWVFTVYVCITRLFGERVFLEQLLRVMGLATAPMALTLFMAVPVVSFAVAAVAMVMTFGATSVAIQSVTSANPLRVMAANTAGFALWAGGLAALVSPGHIYAPGIFIFLWPAELSTSLFDLLDQLQLLP